MAIRCFCLHNSKKCSNFAGDLQLNMVNKLFHKINPVQRRVIYITIAILATIPLLIKPVFTFQSDIGMNYERVYSMSMTRFTLTLTDLETGFSHVKGKQSVVGLLCCAIAMTGCTILCGVWYYRRRLLKKICNITIFFAILYYLFMVFYAMLLMDQFSATLWPNWVAFMPIIVLEMMLLVRRNISKQMKASRER